MICETVKVKRTPTHDNPTGVVIINTSDYVEGQDELYVEGEEAVVAGSGQKEAKATAPRIPKTSKIPVQPWAKTE